MESFNDTFQSRIDQWIADLRNGVPPEQVDGKAEDALKVQLIIEAAIESWANDSVVTVPE